MVLFFRISRTLEENTKIKFSKQAYKYGIVYGNSRKLESRLIRIILSSFAKIEIEQHEKYTVHCKSGNIRIKKLSCLNFHDVKIHRERQLQFLTMIQLPVQAVLVRVLLHVFSGLEG